MSRIPENLETFVEQVLLRISSKLPQEAFETVCDILLKELQYQNIQEKTYISLKKFLEKLESNHGMQKKLLRHVDTLLTANVQFNARSDKQFNSITTIEQQLGQIQEDVLSLSKQEAQEDSKSLEELIEKVNVVADTQEEQKYKEDLEELKELVSLTQETLESSMEKVQSKSEAKSDSKSPDITKVIEKEFNRLRDNLPATDQKEISGLFEQNLTPITTQINDTQKIVERLEKKLGKATSASSTEESKTPTNDPKASIDPSVLEDIKELLEELTTKDNASDELSSIAENVRLLIETKEGGDEVLEQYLSKIDKGYPDHLDNIKDHVENLLAPTLSLIEQNTGQTLRPKDLDAVKAHLAKAFETGLWRVEQAVEQLKEPGFFNIEIDKRIEDVILETFKKADPPSIDLNSLQEEIAEKITTSFTEAKENSNENASLVQQLIEDNANKVTQEIQNSQVDDKQLIDNLKEIIDPLKESVDAFNQEIENMQTQMRTMQSSLKYLEVKIANIETSGVSKSTAVCPHCSEEITAPAAFEGKRVLCNHCKEEFTFPAN